MKKLIAIVFWASAASRVLAQLNEEKVHEFLNAFMEKDSAVFQLQGRASFGFFGKYLPGIFGDTIFTENDSIFMNRQFLLSEKQHWKNGEFDKAHIITEHVFRRTFRHGDGWNKFHKKFADCLRSWSLPIFNQEYTYCVFYHWIQCDYLAGGGTLDLYRWINGKWVFEKSYAMGMS